MTSSHFCRPPASPSRCAGPSLSSPEGGERRGVVGRIKALCRLAVACLTLATCLFGATAAAGDGAPVLRERIKVYSDLVTLGDLFENAGPAASRPVFRSPDLGSHGVVAASRVAAAAREHGLHWNNPGGIGKVTVERPSRLVTIEEIRQAIAVRAARELEAPAPDDVSVTLDRLARPFHVSARIDGPVMIRRLYMQGRGGRFEAVIALDDANAANERERSFHGLVQETITIPVPAKPLERGATIAAGDLHTMRLPRIEMQAGIVTEASELAGMAARRALPADQPVRRQDLERPRLVQRNVLVTLVYETAGLSLKVSGRALDHGAKGDTVAVLNTRSKRTVHGVVHGPGLVAINPSPGLLPTGAAPAPERAAEPAPRAVR